jgi:energy-coupling factor transport system permease protein
MTYAQAVPPDVTYAQAVPPAARLETILGQMASEESWASRVDPRAKLAVFVVFTAVNLMFLDTRVLLALSASTLPLWAVSRVRPRAVMTVLAGYSIFLGGVTLSQGFSPVGHLFEGELRVIAALGAMELTVEGLQVGLSRSVRMANPILFGLWIGLTTDPSMVARALIKLRLPMELAFMFLAALRLLPLIAERAHEVHNAQKVRGVGGRHVVQRLRTMVFPLFLTSIQSARTLGLTMECRAFSVKGWKDFLRTTRFGGKDLPLVAYGLAVLGAGVFVLVFSGWDISTVGNPQ